LKTGRRIGARRKNKISRKDAKITARTAKENFRIKLFCKPVGDARDSVFDQKDIEVDEQTQAFVRHL